MTKIDGAPSKRGHGARDLAFHGRLASKRLFQSVADLVNEQGDDTEARNFGDWVRSRIWIRDKQARVIPFDLNAVQRTYLSMKQAALDRGKPARFLVLKARRFGITTLEQARNYRRVVTERNCEVLTLAHTEDSTKRIFRIAKLMQERDPKSPKLRGLGNSHRLEFPTLNSGFFVITAGGKGPGRGDTLQQVHGSEVSWWSRGPRQMDEQDKIIVGLTEAASHGEVVFETTANGIEWFALTYEEAKKGDNDWTPIFLPWFLDHSCSLPLTEEQITELRETLTEQENFLIDQHKLPLGMIEWRRNKRRNMPRLFAQEYPDDDSSCFLRSGDPFFDPGIIEAKLGVTLDLEREHLPSGYRITWQEPKKGVEYVAGCDTSEGLPTGDFGGVGILRRDTLEQVAAIHGRWRTWELAKRAVDLCREYNDAFLGVEQNNHGHAVLQKVVELGYNGMGELYYFAKGRFGWQTTNTTRPILLDDLAEAIHEGTLLIRDRDFLEECQSFRRQANNKYEADPGAYDDKVFVWGIALQMAQAHRPSVGVDLVEW